VQTSLLNSSSSYGTAGLTTDSVANAKGCKWLYSSHGSVSVFQVGIGFLYGFLKVGSVFGVGFREYRDIGIGFSLVSLILSL
jgi:hypothetical protein